MTILERRHSCAGPGSIPLNQPQLCIHPASQHPPVHTPGHHGDLRDVFPWSILRLKRFSQRRKCRAAQQHLALVFSTDTQINHPDSCRRSEGASMSPVHHRCLPWLKHRSHVGLNAVSILINPDVDINKTKAGLD